MADLARRFWLRQRQALQAPRLPWMIGDTAFTDQCTRCQNCLKACESHIIVIGDGGFPQVDFQHGECTFCYQCADVCPEPLFRPRAEAPWSATASITESCLAAQGVECRSCGDACEPMAIQFSLQPGCVAQPEVLAADCTGCGACVSVCPSQAIHIQSETQRNHTS
ncbi:ferredoxin-type protein NapF [Photobacterium sp. 1_MG-2023]|uniref:ferredoxin-type protein NapF n=1 Tax=Photobacterium sp. 1_MG-2023 TaxID=3062646 RepID=UPI0026E13CDA|nr:ferredoxin-type protein NapF [Photobacterium sp. 1_MG-2023]MDO6705246.1 ferredoxin-type protein NapF [Photobacterium sp. 1_MG-2023]